MTPTPISLTVTSGGTHYTFAAILHRSTGAEDRFLATDFYREYGAVPEEGKEHWEVEITSPDVDTLRSYPSNIHTGKNGQPFMCYPRHLPNQEEAIRWFKAWCVGTISGKDRGFLLNDAMNVAGSREKLFELLREQYDIEILEPEE